MHTLLLGRDSLTVSSIRTSFHTETDRRTTGTSQRTGAVFRVQICSFIKTCSTAERQLEADGWKHSDHAARRVRAPHASSRPTGREQTQAPQTQKILRFTSVIFTAIRSMLLPEHTCLHCARYIHEFPKQYIALKRGGGAKMTEEKLVYRETLRSNSDVL